MAWTHWLRLRLRALFGRRQVESDLHRELQFHFEEQVEANRRFGMADAEARRAAALAFGGRELVKEECREARGTTAIERTLADLRYGVRTLRRTPGFTLSAASVLTLGIGAATAVFTLIDGVLLRPLPYRDPERLVRIFEESPVAQGAEIRSVANPTVADWRPQLHSFDGLSAFSSWSFEVAGHGRPEKLSGAVGTAELFRTLGVDPAIGRVFSLEEEVPGGPKAVILSHRLWTQRYGADTTIVGRPITLDREPYTVIGVMPPGFAYPLAAELWASLAIDHEYDAREARHLAALARLRPGVTIESAKSDLLAAERRLAETYPKFYQGHGIRVIPLRERLVGSVRPTLIALMGAVGLLLLIACSNVANLLITRGIAREGEVAVRLALGADRPRVIRQLLIECLLLFGSASAFGLVLAYWVVALVRTHGPTDVPRLDTLAIDIRVVGFTVAIALATGLTFGLLPALRASNPDLQRTLRAARLPGGRKGRVDLRSGLTVLETAVATTLLVGAGLLVRTMEQLGRVDPGFVVENLLTFHIGLPPADEADSAKIVRFFDRTADQLAGIAGVEAVGFGSHLPLSGADHSTGFRLEGEADVPANHHNAQDRVVTPGYFRALGIPLLAGRAFTDQDRAGSPRVLLINQALARRYFPGRDPIGATLLTKVPLTIVGLVGDSRQFSLDLPPEPELYFPEAQVPWPWLRGAIRTKVPPRSLIPAVEQAIWSIDPEMPVTELQTAADLAAEGVAPKRLMARVIGGFAVAAFVLAALGLYGVVSYQVARRTSEIGIRMTFGARAADILAMVIRQGLVLSLAGVAIGLAAALAASRWLSSFLYGVGPTDPITFGAIGLFLLGVGTLACLVPAFRATRIDPATTVRTE